MRFASRAILVLAGISIALFALLWIKQTVIPPGTFGYLLESACHAVGGKWGNQDRCVTRDC
jgi:hypothetical protein